MASLIALSASVTPAAGATLTVNTKTDELTASDHRCSLREAVSAVNRPNTPSRDCGAVDASTNVIKVPAGTYLLSRRGRDENTNATGDLDVGPAVARLTIQGSGASRTTIDASGFGDRVLTVPAGPSVSLSRLTITGGHAPGGARGSDGSGNANDATDGTGGEQGGAILNGGSLALVAARLTRNEAGGGGLGGNGHIPLNPADGENGGNGGPGGDGGAVFNTGHLTLTDSTVSGNRAGDGGNGGGGSAAPDGHGGAGGAGAPGGLGGGIGDTPGALLTSIRSSISGNGAGNGGDGGAGGSSSHLRGGAGGAGAAGGYGGGIFSDSGTVSASNDTLARNFAGAGGTGGSGGRSGDSSGFSTGGNGGDGEAGGWGGGIFAFAGRVSLVQVTVTENGAGPGGPGGAGGPANGSGTTVGSAGATGSQGSGGGIADQFGSPTLANTIVASDGVGGNCSVVVGEIGDGGHNLVFGDATCPGLLGDPKLRPLADYGGPTWTAALGRGSAARDRVPARGAGCPRVDQRGSHRPQNQSCDIGAFEFATPSVAIKTPADRAHYRQGKKIYAAFSCGEGGIASPIRSCKGTVRNGHRINTAKPGSKTFSVTAVDKAGNLVSKTVHYMVKQQHKKRHRKVSASLGAYRSLRT